MSEYCKRCNVFPMEYKFVNEDDQEVEWCRFCWAEWWARGISSPEDFAASYEETLALIRERYGADPGVDDGFNQGSIQHLGTSLRRGNTKR